MTPKNADVTHHTQIKYPGRLVARRGRQKIAIHSRKSGSCHGILVAVQRSQTSCGSRVPEFDLVIFRAGNQQALGGVPIARFDIPVVASQNGIRSSRGEIEDLQRGVIRRGEEFCVAGRPCEIADCIVMRIINRFDVVEVRTPIFDISLLSSRNQPVVTVGPRYRGDTRLQLVVVGLFTKSARLMVPAEDPGSRTSMTVSKLNAVPFHSMNSPVCPPVRRRLPSGVHLTTVIGFFDLPID